MDESNQGYRAELADVYDDWIGAGDRDDVEFYADLAGDADGPVLELACGTGRVYLELLRAGADADGFDLSTGALDRLREKAADARLEPNVWRDDMTDFAVAREYALAICPFNTFLHLRTVEDQLACLQQVHDALAPGGRFVFDVFVPSFDLICETYGEWETDDVEYSGEIHELRTRSRITDEVEQEFAVENELRDSEGEVVFRDEHRLAMLPKREVELLARLSPFDDWQVAGDFDGSPISDGDTTQVWTLRKAE
ncbi:class I SAM-dependent methyltransferase [Halobacteriales archaeon SW_6_65_15]|nr:MAG: class I SAM-dependent methyltransferase [Halobacteriales archaeon SW_6_65_15]